jgi:hypothetical protein
VSSSGGRSAFRKISGASVADPRLRLDAGAIRSQLTGPNGPVAKDLLKRGTKVQRRAKQLAPVDKGRLQNSISVELHGSGNDLEVRIGTNVVYGIYVHEGTRWTKPNRFLRDALPAGS